ncbi:MAG: malto-oligosyltrehalose trehalohydrolase [PVC group bacterium]|nr:malto-oligosyltrehalose trehalohydrolase [PVC group bacterium]
MKIGAHYIGDRICKFIVWAPFANEVTLKIVLPQELFIPMNKDALGYWSVIVEEINPGTQYLYSLDQSQEKPDPASFYQPDGVHGPSQIIDQNSFLWKDTGWKDIPLKEMILYELHIGTFTPEGTFNSAIDRVEQLAQLGITAIEIMPVAQFPGARNWGYDGVYPFSVQNSYGGPKGLKEFVNACHLNGIAVILDVVYNHLGPEGNYFSEFGPYFTNKYHTPWGNALNFDDAYSYGVRNYFIENVLSWFDNYHIDGLRLDAVHGIYDLSGKHILEEFAEAVEDASMRQGRKLCLIAESELNDTRLIKSKDVGGYGIDAQWCDDFHHALHALLTEEKQGYYIDYGKTEHIMTALKEGFVYSGQYSVFRKKHYGNSSKDISGNQFVVCAQNHDQIGNRRQGERLSRLISFEGLKLSAATVMFSPYVPLLFMGEEYAESAPFLYFVSHSDDDLIASVRKGRKEEFSAFKWKGEASDPQQEETFLDSKLNWGKRNEGDGNILLHWYKELIALRTRLPAFIYGGKDTMEVSTDKTAKIVFVRRWHVRHELSLIMNFSQEEVSFNPQISEGKWKKLIDSSDLKWMGKGALLPDNIMNSQKVKMPAWGFALYEKDVLR